MCVCVCVITDLFGKLGKVSAFGTGNTQRLTMPGSQMSTHMEQLLASCNGVDDMCPRKNVVPEQVMARFLQVTIFIVLHAANIFK